MPNLSPGVAQIPLTAGQVLQFDAGGAGTAFVYAAPHPGHGRPLGAKQVLIGPFSRDVTVEVNVDLALAYTLGKSISGMRDLYTDGASLYDSNGMPLAALNSLVSGGGFSAAPVTTDYAGIIAAQAAIVAACAAAGVPTCGTVRLADAIYTGFTATNQIPVVSGIRYIGVKPLGQPGTTDGSFTCIAGTRLIGDGTGAAFIANGVDKGAPYANAALLHANNIQGIQVENVHFNNFAYNLKFGSLYDSGCHWSQFRELYSSNCTNTSYYFENCQEITCERLFSFDAAVAGLVVLGSSGSLFNYGNSIFRNIYITANQHKRRGLWYGSRKANSTLNDVYFDKVQVNRANLAALNQSATMSAAAPDTGGGLGVDITVTDGTAFDVGMPVTPQNSTNNATLGTAINGFRSGQAYFVSYISGNIIRLSNDHTGAPIAATGSTAINILSWGYSNIFCGAYDGATACQPAKFTFTDTENSATAGIVLQRLTSINLDMGQAQVGLAQQNGVSVIDPTQAGVVVSTVVCRGVVAGRIFGTGQSTGCTRDVDATSLCLFEGNWFNSLGIGTSSNSGRGLFNSVAPTTSGWAQAGVIALTNGGNTIGIDAGLGNIKLSRGINAAQKQIADTGTLLSTGGQGLSWIYTGAAGGTLNLPAINNTAANTAGGNANNIGTMCYVFNPAAGSITIAANGAQTIKGAGLSATTYTLTTLAGVWLMASDNAGTLFWALVA